MFEDVTVNLAPFINWTIYIVLFILFNVLCRWLIRITYGKKLIINTKSKALEVFTEHYREYEFKEKEVLKKKLVSSNKELKNKYGLRWSPISWRNDDMYPEYGSYSEVPSSFSVEINIHKKFWFYRMKLKTKYNERVKYKDCIKNNRENKIDNLLE
jgi:hypothetical protein